MTVPPFIPTSNQRFDLGDLKKGVYPAHSGRKKKCDGAGVDDFDDCKWAKEPGGQFVRD